MMSSPASGGPAGGRGGGDVPVEFADADAAEAAARDAVEMLAPRNSASVEFAAAEAAAARDAVEALAPRNSASVSTPWSAGASPALVLDGGEGGIVVVVIDLFLSILSLATTANGMTRAHTCGIASSTTRTAVGKKKGARSRADARNRAMKLTGADNTNSVLRLDVLATTTGLQNVRPMPVMQMRTESTDVCDRDDDLLYTCWM